MPAKNLIPFDRWEPDAYGLDSDLMEEVKNALPGARGWHPMPSVEEIGQAVSAEVLNAIAFRNTSGSVKIYAATAGKIFDYAGAGTAWTDITKLATTYALPADTRWDLRLVGNKMLAVQGGDPPQVIDVDSGTNFADLGGSPPTARRVQYHSNHVILYDLVTGVSSPENPRAQMQWSGFNDITDWTVGSNYSDAREFSEGGPIGAVLGRTSSLLIQREVVRRFTVATGNEGFNVRLIEELQGTSAPYSVIPHQGVVYYYGRDGFVASHSAAFTKEMGIEFVDDWFKENVNVGRVSMIQGALDPTRPRLMWLAPSPGNDGNLFDVLIGYDAVLGKWFHADVNLTCIFPGELPGTTLEGLGAAGLGFTLETVPASLDSLLWQGGGLSLGAFNVNNKLGLFSGPNLEALFRTSRFQPLPGKRAHIAGLRLLTDAAGATVRVGRSETSHGTIQWSAPVTVQTDGLYPVRASGRYFQIEVTIPAGEEWSDIRGAAIDEIIEDGER